MQQSEAELRIKALQKSFLYWVEDHKVLSQLDPNTFNEIRKRVFRASFLTFRMGKLGLPPSPVGNEVTDTFYAWVDGIPRMSSLPLGLRDEVRTQCFLVTIAAFRIGALTKAE